jgi:uncharacterized membrane protein HdeD (DUF308 family)
MATATAGRTGDRGVAEAFASTWFLFVITGVLWLLLGFLVLSYRPTSVSIAVVFIAIVFAMGALSCFAIATVFSGGVRVLAIIGGVLAVLAAIGTLVWPSPTLLIVSVFVAWYLLVRGIFDVVIALTNTGTRGWWLVLLAGIAGIALGAWAIGNPDRSVLLLITIIGVYAIFHGVADLMAGFQYRRLRHELGSS